MLYACEFGFMEGFKACENGLEDYFSDALLAEYLDSSAAGGGITVEMLLDKET